MQQRLLRLRLDEFDILPVQFYLQTMSHAWERGPGLHLVLVQLWHTYVNRADISQVHTFVCAAEPSQWSISVAGSGGSWTIPAATYRTFQWVECAWPWCGGNLYSNVNTSTSLALHTYCGEVCDD